MDDINIMTRFFISAKEVSINLDKTANKVGLQVTENQKNNAHITINEYNLENVDNFIYSCVQGTKNRNEYDEIKQRI